MKKIELIGYSGHAFVVLESAMSAGDQVVSYYETEEKALNPYGLKYAGRDEILSKLEIRSDLFYFIGIGDNRIRKKLFEKFVHLNWTNIIDPSAVISSSTKTGKAIYIGKNASVNALAEIGTGSIIKTGRTHQIRVHMKSIGHPVVCDKMYGPKKENNLGLERLALHALSIQLTLPNSLHVKIESSLPPEFMNARSIIEK
jgi:hypothetical protein